MYMIYFALHDVDVDDDDPAAEGLDNLVVSWDYTPRIYFIFLSVYMEIIRHFYAQLTYLRWHCGSANLFISLFGQPNTSTWLNHLPISMIYIEHTYL